MQTKENIKFREDIIKKQFKEALGYELNLENPKTYNEKLQWLKLYYHNPLMTKCADKYLAREYIKEKKPLGKDASREISYIVMDDFEMSPQEWESFLTRATASNLFNKVREEMQ